MDGKQEERYPGQTIITFKQRVKLRQSLNKYKPPQFDCPNCGGHMSHLPRFAPQQRVWYRCIRCGHEE